jgi:hypothetical protein
MKQELPSGRRQVVLLSIWRRVYIRDEYVDFCFRECEADQQLGRHLEYIRSE